MGALTDAIEALDASQRRIRRAQAWRTIESLIGRTFTPRAGVTITLNDAWLLDGAHGIGFDVSVTRDGAAVDLSAANPFIFVNPPLCVDVPLTAQQVTALRTFWTNNGDDPSRAQIDTVLTNNGFDPTTHTLRTAVINGVRQFRLLEEAPLKALRDALVAALREAVA